MKEIMMTIHTTSEGDSAVTVNAKFADHASAVRFHEGLASLVKNHSDGIKTFRRSWYPMIGSNAPHD